MREEPPLDPMVLDAWQIEEPPASIEDRAWRSRHRRTARRRALAGVTAAAVMLPLAWFAARGPHIDATGTLVAVGRTSRAIGASAVVVAEDATRVSWRIQGDKVRVEQAFGNAFYRVDAGDFVVNTPHGALRVAGTCFRVEIESMKIEPRMVGATVAAAAVTAVMVTVYEGRVELPKGQTIGPGEIAHLEPKGTTTRETTAVEALRAELRAKDQAIALLKAQLTRTRAASAFAPKTGPGGPVRASGRFAKEARREPWASEHEATVADRLVRYTDVSSDAVSVECRSHCCEVHLAIDDPRLMTSVLNDLATSVMRPPGRQRGPGFEILPPQDFDDGAARWVFCEAPSNPDEDAIPSPERGEERRRLLKQARPGIEACRVSLAVDLSLSSFWMIDRQGAVTSVRTTAEPPGEPATKCVEKALLTAAAFAPAAEPTYLHVRVSVPAGDADDREWTTPP